MMRYVTGCPACNFFQKASYLACDIGEPIAINCEKGNRGDTASKKEYAQMLQKEDKLLLKARNDMKLRSGVNPQKGGEWILHIAGVCRLESKIKIPKLLISRKQLKTAVTSKQNIESKHSNKEYKREVISKNVQKKIATKAKNLEKILKQKAQELLKQAGLLCQERRKNSKTEFYEGRADKWKEG